MLVFGTFYLHTKWMTPYIVTGFVFVVVAAPFSPEFDPEKSYSQISGNFYVFY